MAAKAIGTVIGKGGCEDDTFNGSEILTISVEDTSRACAPSISLGQQMITLKKGEKFPISFDIEYQKEEASKVPDYGLTLSARIENDKGKLLYINDARTSAKDKKIEVIKV
ncbi:unnamed protein product [Didymodactylos carnosus]|uniref:Lipoprotein n=1 Tax=Didymodactylos carnosus TaxID=1234261 RepID=A0A814SBA2_9BILA|nr:unnamed protein product [Didymodactylos carnosus]CAF1144051.1 unnamed protein product [Didymodactylos carnosus]CAF3656368.1 unnamed protein product [Didymodactylos carnosus]CAF3907700.1 unnamed protein product [Didymodactylos carnosus]